MSMGAESLSLPFSGISPIARHHSYEAAKDASETRVTKSLRYLELLKEAGEKGLSDHETAKATGWPLSSVTSIRSGVRCMVTTADRVDISPYGKKTTCWKRRT